jgi:hypothetical protein
MMITNQTKSYVFSRHKVKDRYTMTMDDILKKYSIATPPCGAACGDGWLPIIDKLFAELILLGWDRDLHQVKEKFGTLRVYIGKGSDDLYGAIRKAEARSSTTCEKCGKLGEQTSDGFWIKTLCEECDKNRKSNKSWRV